MSIEEEVIDIVVEQLGVDKEEVTPEKSFVEDLNADSLDQTELIMTFEEKFVEKFFFRVRFTRCFCSKLRFFFVFLHKSM